jgi:hypothetical protein
LESSIPVESVTLNIRDFIGISQNFELFGAEFYLSF